MKIPFCFLEFFSIFVLKLTRPLTEEKTMCNSTRKVVRVLFPMLSCLPLIMKIRHNTLMRLISGLVLIVFIPCILFLLADFVANRFIGFWVVGGFLSIVAYGFFFGWRHVVVRRTVCESSLLPKSFNGYRVLQLSDLHVGTYLRNRRFISKLVRIINAQRADLVVFTGDLVNVSAEEVLPFVHTLSGIRANDGVYSIMGNHDYCEYLVSDKKYPHPSKADRLHEIRRQQQALRHLEGRMGWHLLTDEHVAIHRKAPNEDGVPNGQGAEETIYIIGVENISRPPFPEYGNLEKAMDGLKKGSFKILLSHDPSHWRRGVLQKTDIALTLSGHTHAGQIKIGRFSPAKWAYQEWGGKYVEGHSMLHVSLGIGGTVPFRLGAWPEINIIELRCCKG